MAPTNATSFWKQKSTIYSLLAPVAEVFVCALASHAYVERIFSVCGIPCIGRRSAAVTWNARLWYMWKFLAKVACASDICKKTCKSKHESCRL